MNTVLNTGTPLASPRLMTVRHITKYRYACPVKLGEHQMMFRPRESHDLRLVRTRLEITPTPKSIRWLHDVFDNSLAIVTFDTGTETAELVFDSEVTLEHIEAPHPDYALAENAQTFPFAYSREERLDLVRALERQHPAGEVDRWAAGFLPKDGRIGTMALLRKITLGIREQLTYSRRYERGVQTPAETLAKASGTCRDYAFLMIEGVRSLGLAARFVSGYIFVPNSGDGPVNGGGSTHAWLQVYLPGAGWVDFDPTNSIIGNRNLIRVAVAWAPAQALPLWGTYIGPASCFLGMEVSVSVMDEAEP